MPTGTDPLVHIQRGLTVLADRDESRRYVERIVERARVNLSPEAAWLLWRLEKDPGLDPASLADSYRVEPERIHQALEQLLGRRLIIETNAKDGKGRKHLLTKEGCRTFNQLVTARRERLAELWPEWSPEKREEVAALVRHLAAALVPEAKIDSAAN